MFCAIQLVFRRLVGLFARLWCEKGVSRSCRMFFVTCLMFVGKWAVSVRCLYGVLPFFAKPHVFQKDRTVSLWLPVLPKELLKQLLACTFAYESPPEYITHHQNQWGRTIVYAIVGFLFLYGSPAPIYDQQSPTVNRIPSKPSKILIEKNIFQQNMDPKMTTQKWCVEKTDRKSVV